MAGVYPDTAAVVAAILAAIEPGFQPGGISADWVVDLPSRKKHRL
jgi:hypothetical protein